MQAYYTDKLKKHIYKANETAINTLAPLYILQTDVLKTLNCLKLAFS